MSKYDEWDMERLYSEIPATLLESSKSSPRYS